MSVVRLMRGLQVLAVIGMLASAAGFLTEPADWFDRALMIGWQFTTLTLATGIRRIYQSP